MQVAVWDTYVKRQDGKLMHFDVLVEHSINAQQVFQYGHTYLASKAFQTGTLTTKECKFCHIEQANEEIAAEIKSRGFYIIEIQNCKE